MTSENENDNMELHLVLKVRELQQIIIGQQRLIEVLERKITAAEKAGAEALRVLTDPKQRLAIHSVLDAMQGVK